MFVHTYILLHIHHTEHQNDDTMVTWDLHTPLYAAANLETVHRATMAKHYKVVNPNEHGISGTHWNKCVLCQEDTEEMLG